MESAAWHTYRILSIIFAPIVWAGVVMIEAGLWVVKGVKG